jgi:outer membrane protein insertion porin family
MAKHSYIYSIFIAVFISACSTTKDLPPGEKLYTGAEVKIIDKQYTTKNEATVITTDLKSLLRPKPNSKILGLRVKLYIYQKTRTNKKRGLKQWLNKKFGEAPVLASNVDLDNSSKILKNRLENVSYFVSQVSGDTISKNRTAKAVYTVQTGPAYKYNKIVFPTGTDSLNTEIARSADKSLLKVGDKYNLDVIKGERIRIDARLKEKGFYYFKPEDLIMQYDSTIADHKVDLFVKVKNETSDVARQIYTINNIYVYPRYTLRDTALKLDSAEQYRWYKVIDPRKTVRPFMFKNTVLLRPGEVYNRTEHTKSLNRFIELGPFQHVKNRFEGVAGIDSPKLDVYYFLTQYKRKSLQAEILGRQSSANYNGTQLNINFKNRNTFKGGELFAITLFGSSDIQFGSRNNGFNVYQVGIKPSLSWPRFISPIDFTNNTAFIPRTILNTGYTYISRTKLYTLNSFNASFGYEWKPNLHKQHNLNILEVTYVNAASVSQLYRDSITKTRNPTLTHVIDNQFTFGPSYQYTITNTTEEYRKNTFYFMGKASLSGNIYGLLTGADTLGGKVSKLFGTPFNQYVKLESELRYYRRISPKSKIATRFMVGAGLTYGNSTVMPYSQQFFIGGANSLRGFPARSLGPGEYNAPASLTQGTNFLPDQSGDIKIEANIEYRPKLFSIVEGAIFADAGNIWLLRPNASLPGAAFGKNFLKQIAADVGVGLRFDLTVLVLRTDLAFPIIKPNLPNGQRVVINQIDFRDAKWRGQNLVFNLAIGYPF